MFLSIVFATRVIYLFNWPPPKLKWQLKWNRKVWSSINVLFLFANLYKCDISVALLSLRHHLIVSKVVVQIELNWNCYRDHNEHGQVLPLKRHDQHGERSTLIITFTKRRKSTAASSDDSFLSLCVAEAVEIETCFYITFWQKQLYSGRGDGARVRMRRGLWTGRRNTCVGTSF